MALSTPMRCTGMARIAGVQGGLQGMTLNPPAATHGRLPRAPRAGSPREWRHHMSYAGMAWHELQMYNVFSTVCRPIPLPLRMVAYHERPGWGLLVDGAITPPRSSLSGMAMYSDRWLPSVFNTRSSSCVARTQVQTRCTPLPFQLPRHAPRMVGSLPWRNRRRRAPPWFALHVSTLLSPTSCTGNGTHMHVLGITAVGNRDPLLP